MFSKFLDPKNDVAFGKIFGTEKNKDILIHFLNDVIVFEGKKPIRDVTFLKTIQDPEIALKKTSIVDVLCEDDEGCKYIVEMQVASTAGFEKRAQFYAAKAYCSQANIGDKYHNLKEVIFLAIADYVMFPEKKKYKSDHVLLDKETLEQDLKDFSFTFIELPKFTKTIEQLSTLQEKWCYFFRHAEEMTPDDLEKIIGNDKIIKRVYHELDRFYWTEKELLDYEQAEKAKNDYLASLEKKFQEGQAKERVIAEAEKAEMKIKAEAEKIEIKAKAEAEKIEIKAKAEAEKIEMKVKAEAEKIEMKAKAEVEKIEIKAKAEADKILGIKELARNLRKAGVSLSVIQATTQLTQEEIESL